MFNVINLFNLALCKYCANTVYETWQNHVNKLPQIRTLPTYLSTAAWFVPTNLLFAHVSAQPKTQLLHNKFMQIQSIISTFSPLYTPPITITTIYINNKQLRRVAI